MAGPRLAAGKLSAKSKSKLAAATAQVLMCLAVDVNCARNIRRVRSETYTGVPGPISAAAARVPGRAQAAGAGRTDAQVCGAHGEGGRAHRGTGRRPLLNNKNRPSG